MKILQEFISYRGLPFLSISYTPKDWDGDLLILTGYGLGDTVISLGMQRYFSDLYPQAKVYLLAHPNWKKFLFSSPYPVWFYNDFLGLEENQKLPAPPFPNITKNLQKFFRSSPNSCIGLADIESPERFAQGERFTESVCRMVEVEDLSKIRPFVPILNSDWLLAENFLTQNALSPKSYVLLALEASSVEKEWGVEKFLFVAEKIYECSGYKSVLVHERELPESLNSSIIISSKGLPLAVICGLIAMSKCFIGNDSGPSHIAAAFDMPVLSIYLEPERIPFEIRPLSPLATQIVLFEATEESGRETVLFSIMALLNPEAFHQNPECFACGRPMRHILRANEGDILWKCFCGAMWKSEKKQEDTKVASTLEDQDLTVDPKSLSLPSTHKELNLFKKIIGYCFNKKLLIKVTYKNCLMRSDSRYFLDKDDENIVWSIDSILFFFKKQGYFLDRVDLLKKEKTLIFFLSTQETKSWIVLPWGGKFLRVFGSSLYLQYFAWGSWASSKKLIDLLKSDWEAEKWKDFFWVGLSVFLYVPNVKNFLRWQRIFWKLLVKAKKPG